MFKKVLVGSVAIGFALSAAACGSSGEVAPDDRSDSNNGSSNAEITVGFIPGLASDPFFLSMKRGAEEKAQELGINLIWQGSPDEWSPDTQIPFVDNVLTDGVDVLILNPTDPVALQPSVDKALAADVPVINVDQAVEDLSEVSSFLTGDNVDGGRKAAEALVEQIGGSGKVFILGSEPADLTNRLRVQGFEEVISEHTDIELIGIEYQKSSSDRAVSIINTVLLANPDLDGIFAVNGTGTTGAAAALKSSGRTGDVKLIGYDAYKAAVEELEDGVVTALVAQQPAKLGSMAVEYAYKLVTDEAADIEAEVVLENVVLTAENLEENAEFVYQD